MKVVIQKINYAKLYVDDSLISSVSHGLLITVGVHRDDTIEDAKKLAHKIANMRIFKDSNDKLNLSVLDVNGECLVVSNFSLQGENASGTRPNFSRCADMTKANELYRYLGECLLDAGVSKVEYGKFRSHMHIECELDGPFNLIIHTKREGE